jgi:hypothetical protein
MPTDGAIQAALERAADKAARRADPRVRWVRGSYTYWELSDLCPEDHDVCSFSCIENHETGGRVYNHIIGVPPPPPLPLERRFG